jgi:hypothetical protein
MPRFSARSLLTAATVLGATVLGVTVLGATVLGATVGGLPAWAEPVDNPGGFGTPAVAGLTDVAPQDFQTDVFEVGADHRVVRWHLVQDAVTERQDLGGKVDNGVGASLDADGHDIVLVRGTDAAVWYRQRTAGGSWLPWRSLGGRITGHPSVQQPLAGQPLVVVVRGANGAMYERTRGAVGWSPRWRSAGGALLSSPGIGFGGANYVAYVLGRDHQYWSATRGRALNDTWSGWRPVLLPVMPGNHPNSEPTTDPLFRAVYYRGTDRACWNFGNDFPNNPQCGGLFVSGVAALSQADFFDTASTILSGRGLNGRLYYSVDGRNWLLLGSRTATPGSRGAAVRPQDEGR